MVEPYVAACPSGTLGDAKAERSAARRLAWAAAGQSRQRTTARRNADDPAAARTGGRGTRARGRDANSHRSGARSRDTRAHGYGIEHDHAFGACH